MTLVLLNRSIGKLFPIYSKSNSKFISLNRPITDISDLIFSSLATSFANGVTPRVNVQKITLNRSLNFLSFEQINSIVNTTNSWDELSDAFIAINSPAANTFTDIRTLNINKSGALELELTIQYKGNKASPINLRFNQSGSGQGNTNLLSLLSISGPSTRTEIRRAKFNVVAGDIIKIQLNNVLDFTGGFSLDYKTKCDVFNF